jgi:hypothetical protein
VVSMIGSFVEEPASLKEHGLRAIVRRASAVATRPNRDIRH